MLIAATFRQDGFWRISCSGGGGRWTLVAEQSRANFLMVSGGRLDPEAWLMLLQLNK